MTSDPSTLLVGLKNAEALALNRFVVEDEGEIFRAGSHAFDELVIGGMLNLNKGAQLTVGSFVILGGDPYSSYAFTIEGNFVSTGAKPSGSAGLIDVFGGKGEIHGNFRKLDTIVIPASEPWARIGGHRHLGLLNPTTYPEQQPRKKRKAAKRASWAIVLVFRLC